MTYVAPLLKLMMKKNKKRVIWKYLENIYVYYYNHLQINSFLQYYKHVLVFLTLEVIKEAMIL